MHLRESGALAEAFMKQVFTQRQVPQVVHADHWTSMMSKPVAAVLSDFVCCVCSHGQR